MRIDGLLMSTRLATMLRGMRAIDGTAIRGYVLAELEVEVEAAEQRVVRFIKSALVELLDRGSDLVDVLARRVLGGGDDNWRCGSPWGFRMSVVEELVLALSLPTCSRLTLTACPRCR